MTLKKTIALALAGMFVTLAVCRPDYLKTPVYAWWGSMYPKYCFSQNTEENIHEKVPIKIGFRWLRIK